ARCTTRARCTSCSELALEGLTSTRRTDNQSTSTDVTRPFVGTTGARRGVEEQLRTRLGRGVEQLDGGERPGRRGNRVDDGQIGLDEVELAEPPCRDEH